MAPTSEVELKVSNVTFNFPEMEQIFNSKLADAKSTRPNATGTKRPRKARIGRQCTTESDSTSRSESDSSSLLKENVVPRPKWKKVRMAPSEILNVLDVGEWAFDSESHKMWFSEDLIRIFMFEEKPDETLFHCYQRHIHPDDRDLVLYLLERAVNKGVPYQVTHRFCTSDGKTKWCRTICHIAEQVKSLPTKLCGTMQDITSFAKTFRENRKSIQISCDTSTPNMRSECPIV